MSRYSLDKEGKSKGGYVSTCDGILCFKIDSSSALLFNPSIRNRKFMILPSSKFPDQSFVQITYTLVYDQFINKYKVIALNSIFPKMEVNVHILGTDYWRRIQDFPISNVFLLGTEEGIFVSDSVNWLVSKFVVSLDLEKESYQKFSLPASDVKLITSMHATLGTLRGCLSFLFSGKCLADIWIMKEFGNEKSWTKLLTVPYFKAWGRCRLNKVLYISEDDQVLMEIYMAKKKLGITVPTYRVVVYDSINNTYKFPEFQNKIHDDDDMVPEVYVESLISPF
jgi:F-box interacting protein